MKEIVDVYEAPYFGFDLTHGDRIEGYTVRKLSSGDYEIYVQEGNPMTGGAYTTGLYKKEMEGKSYEEVIELLPNGKLLKEVLLKDDDMKHFLGFKK